jgi:sodium/potassium-transporting ATPase subunit alpha
MDVPFDQRAILGDATETGLTRFAGRSLNVGYDQHQKDFPKVFEVPFNSTNKWALVIVCLHRFSSLGVTLMGPHS